MKASALLSLSGASVIYYLESVLISFHFLAKIITTGNGRLIVFERTNIARVWLVDRL
jgi:hypothetical protein